MNQLTAGTGRLTGMALRRVRLPVWLIAIAGFTWMIVWALTGLYGDDAERQAIAATMHNPAMVAMVGPGYGLDNYTLGALVAHQLLLFTAIAVGIMAILLTASHTRAEEEDGRTELVRALPVGRLSSLAATAIVLTAANVLLALLVGLSLYALGIVSIDLEGSLLYGAALGVTGLFFTALTALFAQLAESARGTVGLSLTVLIFAYLIRAVGDVSNETLSYLSPFGWVLRTEVYVNNYWLPVFIVTLAAAALFLLAFFLDGIRDLEAGFLPSRRGKKKASLFLQGPFGLAVRLQRTALIAWAVGMFILGLSYGSVLGDLESYFANNEMLETLLPPDSDFSLAEQFVSLLLVVMAMICTTPVLLVFLKLKGEEKKGRVSHVFSRAVSRGRQLGSYLGLAVAVSVLVQLLTVFGLWLAGKAVLTGTFELGSLVEAAVVYLPAMWVMTAVGALLLGIAPKWTGLAYLYLAYSFFVVYLGDLLQLPDWLAGLSPFDYVSRLPIEELDITNSFFLLLIATVLTGIGFYGYSRRDLME
ncbi:ABC transporter permease [Planococcus lenghuensis]|uniref:ABC transporter permease n=1 Tax=Planococcus lenghuensis TaxID=2213202 RepID=A0A1Q2KUF4_9BACL|nr:ABC transporter permease subunit [Planococcus lenghuensis]AQQ51845.1 ABC transporter permease [Planococcus lenghuensis]